MTFNQGRRHFGTPKQGRELPVRDTTRAPAGGAPHAVARRRGCALGRNPLNHSVLKTRFRTIKSAIKQGIPQQPSPRKKLLQRYNQPWQL
jgi:hypothetical protein